MGLGLTQDSNRSGGRAAGFSLVEVMVAMVIGMFGIIVMMQLFSLAEDRKRTTTGAGDAYGNGAIALYGLQRDVRQSGYGFSILNLFACNVTLPAPSSATVPLAPVIINPATSVIPAGDADTDTILVAYGNTNGQPQGNKISSVTGNEYDVQMASSFAVGDRVVAAPASCVGNLALDSIAAVPPATTTPTRVRVGTGTTGTTLFNLGQSPKVLAYAVRNGNLTVCDYLANNCGNAANTGNASIWVPIANNVVRLKAQYGFDTSPMTGVVGSWSATTPHSPSSSCDFARAIAFRFALVVRNGHYDKAVVTSASPTWAGSAGNAIDLSKKPNGTADPDWGHYRYNVFQTVVPLRNVTWMGVQPGC